jgi:hypothetical protein
MTRVSLVMIKTMGPGLRYSLISVPRSWNLSRTNLHRNLKAQADNWLDMIEVEDNNENHIAALSKAKHLWIGRARILKYSVAFRCLLL